MNNNPYYERLLEVEETKGNLPHWKQDAKIYFVTFRLGDSIPQCVLEEYKMLCDIHEKANKRDSGSSKEKQKIEIEIYRRMQHSLDMGYGSCILKEPHVRSIVVQALNYLNNKQCIIHDYVIMPNHIHLLLEMLSQETVTNLIGDFKKFTSRKINEFLGRNGTLWQRECYDRIIRNEEHYMKAAKYIARNPRFCSTGSYTLFLLPEHEEFFGISSIL